MRNRIHSSSCRRPSLPVLSLVVRQYSGTSHSWDCYSSVVVVPSSSLVTSSSSFSALSSSSSPWRTRYYPITTIIRQKTILPSSFFVRCFTSTKNNKSKEEEDHQEEEQHLKRNQNQQVLFWNHWIQELQSPPNIITTTRILCTPLLAYWIVLGEHKLALSGCILAAASDYADGYLAKNYNMTTVLGAYLDPMADKIFINVLAGSLWYTSVLPAPLVALWFTRDILLIGGAAYHVRSQSQQGFYQAFDPTITPLKVNPTLLSKANTSFQFITIGIGIVYPFGHIPPEILNGFCYLTGFTTVASGFSYLDYSAFSDSGNHEKSNNDNDKDESRDEKEEKVQGKNKKK